MRLPNDPRLAPTSASFQLTAPDFFFPDANPFASGTFIKFDGSTNDPTPENSEECDSKLDEEFPGFGAQLFRKVFSFNKERVFSNVQSRDLGLLGCGQRSYHRAKSILAVNQKSVISLLVLDEFKQETFLQKAVRSKAALFSSCSFFDHPSSQLLAYSCVAGPVKVFDADSQKNLLSLDFPAHFVEAFSTSLAGIDELGRCHLFDIRSATKIASMGPTGDSGLGSPLSISRAGHGLAVAGDQGVFFTDLRKPGFVWNVKAEVSLRSPLGSPLNFFQAQPLSFKKQKADTLPFTKAIFLGNGRLLLVDMGTSSLVLVETPSFRVLASFGSPDQILDFAISKSHQLVTLLTSPANLAGFRKLTVLDFDLQLQGDTCLDKPRYTMLGFCGEEESLLLNDCEDFSLFKRSDI